MAQSFSPQSSATLSPFSAALINNVLSDSLGYTAKDNSSPFAGILLFSPSIKER